MPQGQPSASGLRLNAQYSISQLRYTHCVQRAHHRFTLPAEPSSSQGQKNLILHHRRYHLAVDILKHRSDLQRNGARGHQGVLPVYFHAAVVISRESDGNDVDGADEGGLPRPLSPIIPRKITVLDGQAIFSGRFSGCFILKRKSINGNHRMALLLFLFQASFRGMYNNCTNIVLITAVPVRWGYSPSKLISQRSGRETAGDKRFR